MRLIERDGVDGDGLVGSPWVWAGYQGNAYGVPSHGAVPRGLAYNISLFEEAGVKLPRYDDWTMDEMDAAVKAIASPPEIWGAAVPPNMIYLDLIMSNGGSLFNEDETQCLLNSDEAREAFTYSVDWLLESGVSPTPSQQQLLGERIFASDKIGMVAAVLSDWDSWGANTQDYALNADNGAVADDARRQSGEHGAVPSIFDPIQHSLCRPGLGFHLLLCMGRRSHYGDDQKESPFLTSSLTMRPNSWMIRSSLTS